MSFQAATSESRSLSGPRAALGVGYARYCHALSPYSMEATAKMKSKAAPSRVEEQKAPASQEAKRAPIKTFLEEDVSASIFSRQVVYKGQHKTFYSISFSKSYKDLSDEYKYTKNFDVQDLPKVVIVAQKAAEYLTEPLPVD